MVSCRLQVSRNSKSSFAFLSLKSSFSSNLNLVRDEGPYLCLSTCMKSLVGGNLSLIRKVNTKVITLIMMDSSVETSKESMSKAAGVITKIYKLV